MLGAALALVVVSGLAVLARSATDNDERKPRLEHIEWCDIWIPEANTDAKPRVLLVGDSITRGYFGVVEQELKDEACCARLATSRCICDPVFLDELRLVLSQYDFAVVHFNNGLHGWGYTEEEYREAFPRVLELLRGEGGRLIWATTTPVMDVARLEHLDPRSDRVRERNAIAAKFVADASMLTDDLCGLVEDHPEYYAGDGVHFNEAGRVAQGRQVAASVRRALAKSP